jgi:PAS domain S-box-containing protein
VAAEAALEAALRESEQRYRTLVEMSPDAVHVHRAGIIILANRQAAALFGAADPDDLVGRPALSLVDPASLPLARARTEALTAPGRRNPPTEMIVRRLDGTPVAVEASSAAVLLDGKLAVQAVVRDVTDRRRAEAELRRSEEQRRLAFEAAGLGLWDVDYGTGKATFDARFRTMYGLPDAEVPPEAVWARVHPDDAPRLRAAVAAAKDPAAKGVYEVEYRAVLPGGGERWHLAKAQVHFEGDGAARRPTRFVGVVMDVTERRRAEAALRESEARYRATQEHAGVGIGEVDAEGRFLRVNGALAAITGYAKDELLGRTVFDVTHPDDARGERGEFARLVAGGTDTYAREKRYLRKGDGAERWVEVAATAVRDPAGRFLYGVRVVQDVTDRKLADARQRLLLDELNHRVKNTLAVVLAMARQTAAGAGDLAGFRAAFEGRLRALAAAHDLLAAGGWARARLGALVRAALAAHAGTGEDRVRVEVADLPLGAGVAQDLMLALHELATNAAKHGALSMPEGRVVVEGRVVGGELLLTWTEAGGPPVAPPTRRSFGTLLLERVLAHQHGGRAAFRWRPEGLAYALHLPLSAVADRGEPILPRWDALG